MSDHDVDDIAFLTGSPNESGWQVNKRAMYEPSAVMVCSQKKACVVVTLCFFAITGVALIVALTKSGCPEAQYTGEPLPGMMSDSTGPPPATPPTATNGVEFPWHDVRLPFHIRPLLYTIELHPNLTTRFVKGTIIMKITCIEETTSIIIHGKDLNISSYSLHNKYDQPIHVTSFLIYPHHEQMYFEVDATLKRGSNYTLRMTYDTLLKETLEGFYLSSYKDQNDEIRTIATTHFEPTSARSAFPCFDEPNMKAKFQLSIVREPQHFTLSNMPLQTTTLQDNSDLEMDTFIESVEMSTYLVAFIVCDYEHVYNRTRNNVTISVYAPSVMINQASYALKIATQILEYNEQYFGVPYPLPKLDMIAIPNFGAGAMENWGLITYRETALMFDPEHTSSRDQQRVAVVVAHELAHQWFGNLVTMKWWSDLWLNEGFASYMENRGAGEAEPGWDMGDQFVIEKVQPALELDALQASHPISTNVTVPEQIESLFDTISYKKGASMIGMLESFIGRALLQKGLRLYLSEYRYNNAETNDLWGSLTKITASNDNPLDIKVIMDTWTLQAGFPLVFVTLEDGHVTATQNRFLICEENITETNVPLNDTIGFKWHIPLTYVTNIEPQKEEKIWMNLTNVEFNVDPRVEWVKMNVGQLGFYRVSYDQHGWSHLIQQLKDNHTALKPSDRASLIDDAFTLVKAGSISATVPLDLTQYLMEETKYVCWHTALRHLFEWLQLLFNYPARTLMIKYIHTLVRPMYLKTGWEDTGSHLYKLLRSEILMATIDVGDEDAIKEAKSLFYEWRFNNKTISVNIRAVVYKTGVRYGREDDWRHCWHVYNTTDIPSEKVLMLQALAQTREPWLMQQYLEYTLDTSKIRSQDVRTVLREVASNPGGRLPAWRMVREHWNKIVELFGSGSFTIGAIIKAVTSPFTSAFDLQEVSHFFNSVSVGSGQRSLAQATETIRLNIQWHEYNLQTVSFWLHKKLKHLEDHSD